MLELELITKRFKEANAVDRISLSFEVPGIYSVLGPSGSGKTTLLRLIAGLEIPDQGRVLIDGEEVSTPQKVKSPSKRRLSLIFQDLALWPHMTARENLAFVISGNGFPKAERRGHIDRILRLMHLEAHENRYPVKLSGGERQRLAIARALINKPRYLLMDEPFTGLDPFLIKELKEIILKLKRDFSMAIIYVTHNIEIALALADKIAIMNKGMIEQSGDKEEIINNPKNDFVQQFIKLGMTDKG